MNIHEIERTHEILKCGDFTAQIDYQEETIRIKRTGGDVVGPCLDISMPAADMADLGEVIRLLLQYMRPVERKERPEQRVNIEPVTGPGYKGLFYLDCPGCGSRFFAAAKYPTTRYICRCGHEIKLEKLTRLESLCGTCGETTSGWTNTDADAILFPCKKCGGDVRAYYSAALDRHMSAGVAV